MLVQIIILIEIKLEINQPANLEKMWFMSKVPSSRWNSWEGSSPKYTSDKIITGIIESIRDKMIMLINFFICFLYLVGAHITMS